MQNTHQNLWLVSALAVFLLVAVAVAPAAADSPASAGTLFSIPGKTSVVFPNNGISTMSAVDYGPLNIPSALLQSETPQYQLVIFDDVIPVHTNSVSLPIVLNGQSYTVPLTRVAFESINDGIDSYKGSIPGIDNSVVLVTVSNNNFYASIYLPDDIIEIYPIQNQAYAARTDNPVHIIYSENCIPSSSGPVNIFSITELSQEERELLQLESVTKSQATIMRGDPEAWAIVGVLVVTDNGFISAESDWQAKAQQYMLGANYAFNQAKVDLGICAFDSSKASQMSSNSLRFTNPLGMVSSSSYYPYTFLRNVNADLAVYLGGYDRTGQLIGEGYFEARHSWAQMVPDSLEENGANTGSVHARKAALTRGLGANFAALEGLAVKTTGNPNTYTVMEEIYYGASDNNPDKTLLTFSDANINRIKNMKSTVANYV